MLPGDRLRSFHRVRLPRRPPLPRSRPTLRAGERPSRPTLSSRAAPLNIVPPCIWRSPALRRKLNGPNRQCHSGLTLFLVRLSESTNTILEHLESQLEETEHEVTSSARFSLQEGRERLARALADVGIVENLTSVLVLVYGHFALQRGAALWNWPVEAASQRLPIWLTAVHLKDSRIVPKASITRVISIENETSFLDLVEQQGDNPGVALVYTEGQVNRAVVAVLRLLSEAAPLAQFQHQGDLDLPGLRILASLCDRAGLSIQPAFTLTLHADTLDLIDVLQSPGAEGKNREAEQVRLGLDDLSRRQ